jgi:hypothetical protein
MRHLLPLLLICAAVPALGQTAPAADVFDRLTGAFGTPFGGVDTCRDNPHSVRFSADRTRVAFRWGGDIRDYRGEWRAAADYSVLGHDDTGITMALDGETRLTDAGNPVVWILRPVKGLDGYCWGRTDWPLLRCIAVNVRCAEDALG